jgi:hypothetical protein
VEHVEREEDLEVGGWRRAPTEDEEEQVGHEEGVGMDDEGVGVMGLLQDPHRHTDLGGEPRSPSYSAS